VPGKLIVVATPLGNLEDLSPRALQALREVDCIACEDTRRTARLLARHGLKTPTFSCHRFNEHARLKPILERLTAGQSVGLVSDSGTPGIADPGALLIQEALTLGLEVLPIPGPSAVTTLLSVCGFSADRYVFDGFLPHRGGERRRRLRELRGELRPLVLFETPHRIRDSLADMVEVLGSRQVVLGRELTKLHESIRRGTPAELLQDLDDPVRGEITMVVKGSDGRDGTDTVDSESRRILATWHEFLTESGGDRRQSLKLAARRLGMKRPELYRRLTELDEEPD
jgi:16S rRNA (cytidine1402-2'-O)-methyltransferase